MLIAGACLAALAAFLAGAVLIDWFAVARGAERAAELSALAGASAAAGGGDGCAAAAGAAERNEAMLRSCSVAGGGESSIVVVVVVEARLARAPDWVPAVILREATAGTG